jgi:hypothetical protein
MFGTMFYVLLVSSRYYLDDVIYSYLKDLEEQDFEQQLAGNLGKFSLTILILYSLSLYLR